MNDRMVMFDRGAVVWSRGSGGGEAVLVSSPKDGSLVGEGRGGVAVTTAPHGEHPMVQRDGNLVAGATTDTVRSRFAGFPQGREGME